jgi:hypothetical protein
VIKFMLICRRTKPGFITISSKGKQTENALK